MSGSANAAGGPVVVKRYDVLDGLRGIAALVVVWLHITGICRVFVLPSNAFLAVDFFFCLSGFVIANAQAHRRDCKHSVGSFMRRRSVRLMPLAVFGAALGGCVLLVRSWLCGDVAPANALAAAGLNALLLPSGRLVPVYQEAFGANPALWSLLEEMLASLAFAAGVARLTAKSLTTLVAAAACVTIGVGLAESDLDFGWSAGTAWLGPVRAVFPFLSGVLIQRLPTCSNFYGWVVVIVSSTLLLTQTSSLADQLLSVLVLFPVIIYGGAGARVGPWFAGACRRFGALSYPLYAVHYPLVRLVALWADWASVNNPVLIAAVAVTLSLSVAVIAMMYVEPTARRWLALRLGASGYDRRPPGLSLTTH